MGLGSPCWEEAERGFQPRPCCCVPIHATWKRLLPGRKFRRSFSQCFLLSAHSKLLLSLRFFPR